ncbi:Gfo/Idh/MocA family oxidoreductase [Thermodesulfobacteriota bacterium]
MTKNGKNIALIGLGYWGKNLLRCLHELGVLHTACDSSPQIIAERKQAFPDIAYTDSFGTLLSNPDITAVVIGAPAALHYALAKEFLQAGKDVFVEKPLALNVDQGQALVALARQQQRILMVGHILNYHPAVIKLKEMVASGDLGKIQYIYSNRLNIGKLRTEENILWSFAPHDISIMLQLLGEEPIQVFSCGGAYLNSGIYDTTMTTLRFRNGVKGHIFVSWLHPYKEQKLIVVGSKAMVVFDDMSKEKLFRYPHQINWMEGKLPVAQKAEYEVISFETSEPLKNELSHFIDCMQTRRKPWTDGEEGLRVLKVLERAEKGLSLAEQSSREKISQEDFFVHDSAVVDSNVKIGRKTKIWHYTHILGGSVIGERCVIGQNACVGPDVFVGNGCKIQNNVSVYKGVVLEEDVFCGPSCVFTNVYNPRAFIERKHEFKETVVKKGASLGANATIVCGNSIGKYAVIGAGAVVKSAVPDYAVVAGVPARQIGWACKCGTTLQLNSTHARCGYCSNEYELQGEQLVAHKEDA